MPLYLPLENPLFATLARGNYDVHPAENAPEDAHRILFINQMPKEAKPATEVQWARLLEATREDVHVTLALPDGYGAKGENQHYRPFSAVRGQKFDGLIVTGAPLEFVPFEDVRTWDSLREIFDWSKDNVGSSLFVCWAASAALKHFYGVEKRLTGTTPQTALKLFGVFGQELTLPKDDGSFADHLRGSLRGRNLAVPVSRYCYATRKDIEWVGLEVILDSDDVHPGLVCRRDGSQLFSFNHFEYDRDTLEKEYLRDIAADRRTLPPANWDSTQAALPYPPPPWRALGEEIVSRWLQRAGLAPHVAATFWRRHEYHGPIL